MISTHVLDTARGHPAEGVAVVLEREARGEWEELARATTDGDGRVRELLPAEAGLDDGRYRLTFDTGQYFRTVGDAAFYPEVVVVFTVAGGGHHHVPLLLSPFGYTTYRGS
ncbi:MAG TPA: hydroxyisourate hydrolase [Solirubrobacteraceae bacterium]